MSAMNTDLHLDRAAFTLSGRILTTVTGLSQRLMAWSESRATRRVLSKLTDRELDDIGLCRADIARF